MPRTTLLAQCRPVHSTLLKTITTLVDLVSKANRAAFLAILSGAYHVVLGACLALMRMIGRLNNRAM